VVAEPVGWKANEAPVAAQGLAVGRFADGLDHPRAVTVLPNGDVLVAETNAPPGRGPGGITGLVMNWLFRRSAPAGLRPTRSRCCAIPMATARPTRSS
jgi:glucose/arabinose dehydrogenase